ncbi:glycerophosphodiester phosphodiesterase [Bacillaceae bacterium Marseille-Q3522]|nr:glycerophosphodiester phosphodiesterase [Bacillaceae bacterium Marseille-Q3522]
MTEIFAHRGYTANVSENTMSAFYEAEKAGADGIELDVQLTKDGTVVVIHDEKVNRTTDGSGYVKDFLYADIKKLNANARYKRAKKEPIPALEEVLQWLTTNQLQCNIELKNGSISYKGLEEKVVELVTRYQLSGRVIFSSFNHYSIVHCYRLAPEIETAPLFSTALYMPWVYAKSIRAKGIHPKYTIAKNEWIIAAMEAGIAVRPYTVNKEKHLRRLIQINCSAVITDDPLTAIRIRGL